MGFVTVTDGVGGEDGTLAATPGPGGSDVPAPAGPDSSQGAEATPGSPDSPSRSDRELLKAVYRLTDEDPFAHTTTLAAALRVAPGTVSAGVKRLALRGLLDHKPYRGVSLTPSGRRAAVAAIRRHRIVERFLADMLGYQWNEADRLAGRFEHDLPQEVEDRMFSVLGCPSSCPHGFPIPSPDEQEIQQLPRLYGLEPGDVAVIAVPGSTDPQVVSFLEELGVRPGVRIEVREKHPFDGPLVLRVKDGDKTVSEKLAQQIYVRREQAV